MVALSGRCAVTRLKAPAQRNEVIMGTRKVVRDTETGQFVEPGEAKKRPKSTVTETITTPSKKKKKTP